MLVQQALQETPIHVFKRKTLITVLFTVQICGTIKIDYAHSSSLQVNPASASTLSCLLKFSITDTIYLLYVYISLNNQAP